jgi:hypothetical protein
MSVKFAQQSQQKKKKFLGGIFGKLNPFRASKTKKQVLAPKESPVKAVNSHC